MPDTDGGRSRWAHYRDRQRGGPPRQLEPHGSVAAARRHQRAGETFTDEDYCEPCADAWSDHQHAQYLRRRGHTEDEITERLAARQRERAARRTTGPPTT